MKYVYLLGIAVALGLIAVMFVNAPDGGQPPSAVSPAVSSTVTIPEPTNYIVDVSDVLTDDQEASLNETLKGIDNGMNAEIGVALVPTFEGLSPEEYGILLAEKWQPGGEEDRGMVLAIATEDRLLRFEVGYGLEGVIADSTLGSIVDSYMVPHLKVNDWYTALNDGLLAVGGQVSQ